MYEISEKDKKYNEEMLNDCKILLSRLNSSYNNCIINYKQYNNENILSSIDSVNYCINKNKGKEYIYDFSRKYNMHPDKVDNYCNLYRRINTYINGYK
jgi:hypothetical protein